MQDLGFGRLNEAARARVLEHLDLTRTVARRYRFSGLPIQDLEGEATMGLLRAAQRYEDRGRPFAVYATLWMKSYVRGYLARRRVSAPTDEAAVLDTLPSQRPTPEQSLDQAQALRRLREVLSSSWDGLDARERALLQDRLMTDEDPLSLATLAKRFGVSGERVRQVEAALLAKLRVQMIEEPVTAAA
ncbi:MAG: sigma-70 family RNA polymerase sigma factor [Myxococcota bacterium]|nr:sigma-70 family RNA polymerase sigma factor [Myxococcota bacterium]